MATLCLWGWHRGDLGYEFVTGQFAYLHGLEAVGWPDWSRDMVTVIEVHG